MSRSRPAIPPPHGRARLEAPAPPWPVFADDERAAVESVLASGKVNSWTGENARLFEREYAAYLGVERSVALMNGTIALELPLRLWGVGPGDDVIVTPRSFIASVSCVALLGARPVFADVDPDSGNLTAATIERALTSATRAIVLVHLAGWPCELEPILELAHRRGIKVLEDCAQAHGARYRGVPVGSLGDAAAFSFCQDKILTTAGEGGLLATQDESLWEQAWSFKDHGKTWAAIHERSHGVGFRWVHERFGTNYRMTEMQAAVGRLQLRKLDDWVDTRRRNAGILEARLSGMKLFRVPKVPEHLHHSRYKFYAYVRPEALAAGWTRDRIVAELAERGVPCFSGSCPEIYRERAFEGTGWVPPEPLPVARRLGETSLMFLVHPTLPESYLHDVCDVVQHMAAAATA